MRKYPSGLDERRELLIRIADLLWRDADRLVVMRCFMETGDRAEITKSIVAAGNGGTAMAVKLALVEAILMRCVRACDPDDGEKHSIPAAKTLLLDSATFGRVARDGDKDALARFMRLATKVGTLDSHKRVRKARSYYLAHHLPQKASKIQKATFQDLRIMTNDVILASAALAHGIGINRLTPEGVAQIWKPRCQKFWQQLATKD